MEKITLLAKSSSGDEPYFVDFLLKHGSLSVHCSCKAGEYGQLCKHKLALVTCDESMLYDKEQAVRATPNSIDDGKFKNGYVIFILLKPNEDRTKLETTGQYHLTQNEFVEYLRTGVLKEGAEDLKA